MFVQRKRVSLVAAALACAIGPVARELVANTTVIVISGQPAPEGGTFIQMRDSVINEAGQVSFEADTRSGTTTHGGLFIASGGLLSEVAREGRAAPGGGNYGIGFSLPSLNNLGQVAYWAWLDGMSSEGIYRGSGGPATLIARRGQLAPGGGAFHRFSFGAWTNDSGQVAFTAELTGTTANRGVYLGSGGAVTEIARLGQTAPDGNGTYSFFSHPLTYAPGQVVFHAQLQGTTASTGIFRGAGGAITQLARAGQAAPDGNGVFSEISAGVSPVSFWYTVNPSGNIAFAASLTGTTGGDLDNRGIFRTQGTSTIQVARKGQLAPDRNGVFSGMSTPMINASGQVAFSGSLTGTSDGGSHGIFVGSGGPLNQIARAGQFAPDGNGRLSSLGLLDLNDGGLVLFRSTLTGTSGGTADNSGLFLGDGIDVVSIARKGQSLLGSTISSLREPSPRMGNEQRALNNLGQVVYTAYLADDRSVVIRWTPLQVRWASGSGQWSDSSRWLDGIAPTSMFDTFVQVSGGTTVLGPLSPRTVNSLTIGSTGPGLASLSLTNGGDLAAKGPLVVETGGRIVIGDNNVFSAQEITNSGQIELVGRDAQLISRRSSAGSLLNNGILRGTGRITGALINATSGSIRVNLGERLTIAPPTGPVENLGRIEVVGGELEFDGALWNGRSAQGGGKPSLGLVSARDAVLRFNGGLRNFAGDVAFSFGASDVFGSIINNAAARVILSGDARVTFYNVVINEGEVRVGSGASAVFFGEVLGSGAFTGSGTSYFEGTLSPGSSPGRMTFAGDVAFGPASQLIMEIGGTAAGMQHDQLAIAGRTALDGALSVRLIDGFMPQPGQRFDLLTLNQSSGQFASLDLPKLGGDLYWETSRLYSAGTVWAMVPSWFGVAGTAWQTPDNWSGSDVIGAGGQAYFPAWALNKSVDLGGGTQSAGVVRLAGDEDYALQNGVLVLNNNGSPAQILTDPGNAGHHAIHAMVQIEDDTSIRVAGGRLSLSGGVKIAAGQVLTVEETTGSLSIRAITGGTGALKLADGTTTALTGDSSIGKLGIDGDARLDLAAALSIGTASIEQVNALVASGRNGGAWDGPGINSSAIAAGAVHRTLAVLPDGDGVRIRYTWAGDLNGDGVVDAADYFVLDRSLLIGGGSLYAQGDIDYSGGIDGDDYFLIDGAYLNQHVLAGGASSSAVAVPEPSTVAMAMGLLGLLVRRRRQGERGSLLKQGRLQPPGSLVRLWRWQSRTR